MIGPAHSQHPALGLHIIDRPGLTLCELNYSYLLSSFCVVVLTFVLSWPPESADH